MEKNYHCTIDALDYLIIQNHQEGINFIINMRDSDPTDFSSPAIVLTKKEVLRLINELTEIIK